MSRFSQGSVHEVSVDHSTCLTQFAVCAEARTFAAVYSEALWRDLAKWACSWLIPPESYHGHCCEEVVCCDEEMQCGDVGIYLPAAEEYVVPVRSAGGALYCELGPQLLPLHIPGQMQLHIMKGAFNKGWLTWVPLRVFGALLIFCNLFLPWCLAREHKPWEVL